MSTPTPLTITTATNDTAHSSNSSGPCSGTRCPRSRHAPRRARPLPPRTTRRRPLRTGLVGAHLPPRAAPVGLAVLRGLDEEEHIISSFFIAHGARRSRIGRAAVTELTEAHPGRWAVAYQDRNEVAAKFWRTVATEIDPTCTFEHHAVPGQPELPADSWARFGVR